MRTESLKMLVVEDGEHIWRTVQGEILVGISDHEQGRISMGLPGQGEGRRDWAVIQTEKKLVAYVFDKYVEGKPRTGTIHVCDSWEKLEALVPPNVFNSAAERGKVRKSDPYPEKPLEL